MQPKFNIIIPPQDIEQNPQCLACIAAGDTKAFEWLYKNYCSKVYDYAFLLTADKHMSDDIVQDVFLKIWTQKAKLATLENFNPWVYSITRNHIMDLFRKQATEKEHLKKLQPLCETTTSINDSPNDNLRLINDALNTLTARQKLVYTLVREERMTREKVGAALKISPCTVKATMQKALHNIKEYIIKNEHHFN